VLRLDAVLVELLLSDDAVDVLDELRLLSVLVLLLERLDTLDKLDSDEALLVLLDERLDRLDADDDELSSSPCTIQVADPVSVAVRVAVHLRVTPLAPVVTNRCPRSPHISNPVVELKCVAGLST
jgi:hypothetical protein